VRGPVSLIASELGASFGRVAKGGTELTSALSEPSLPESVGGPVLSITGLQPHRRATRISSHHVAAQLRTGTGGIAEALPGDIAASYDFPSNLDGTGQTIATVGDAVSAMSEFDYFWTAIGSPQSSSRVTIVEPPLVNNTPWPSNPTDELETALDVEWAGALAPGASLRVYFYADIFDAIGSMLNDVPTHPSMRVLSISYGGPEATLYDPSYAQTFAQLAAAGVTVLAAGSELPGGVAKEGSLVYPGSDPNVTSVGGTRDYFTSSGSTTAFGPFIFTLSPNSYGLFGPSTLFPVPAWQSPALLAAQARTLLGSDATAGRWVPDVAAFASGDLSGHGVYAFIFGAGGEEGVIGTSISAPIWASVACLANQERARIGGSPMGAWMPALYGTTSLATLNMVQPILQPTASGYYVEEIGLGRPDVAQLILCVADRFYAYTDRTTTGIAIGGVSTITARTSSPAVR
jgi:kumamolisin